MGKGGMWPGRVTWGAAMRSGAVCKVQGAWHGVRGQGGGVGARGVRCGAVW